MTCKHPGTSRKAGAVCLTKTKGVEMFNLFKRKPPPPLNEAINLIHEAIEIAYKHQRDKHYMPTEEDIELFKRIEEVLWQSKCTAEYITRCMQQRMNGEPEGAKKWHDKEVFDWHYPQ